MTPQRYADQLRAAVAHVRRHPWDAFELERVALLVAGLLDIIAGDVEFEDASWESSATDPVYAAALALARALLPVPPEEPTS